ncbi:hypothetical protein ABIC47_002907 [Leifsonia sp. 563]
MTMNTLGWQRAGALSAVLIAVEFRSNVREERKRPSVEVPAEELVLTGQLRERVSGWRDAHIEDLSFAVLSIEVADDLEHRLDVSGGDEFTDSSVDRLQAANNSFNLLIDAKPGLAATKLPGVRDRTRWIDSPTAPHRDPVWIEAERFRDRIGSDRLTEQPEVDILTNPHNHSLLGTQERIKDKVRPSERPGRCPLNKT